MDKKKKGKKENKEISNLKDQLARALADYDNLSKRVEREQEGFVKFASGGLIAKIIPVIDMFESAQEHLKDQGLEIALKELKDVLKEEGVEKINAQKGDEFDEELHEAVDVVENGKGSEGKIADVLLSGWKYSDGLILRPVKVKVFEKSKLK